MFKAKQRITSMFVAFCTFLVTAILAISMIAVPTNSVTASADTMEIEFTLGANGSASHADGSSATTYSETVDGYKLDITGGNKMYTGARDAKGNSCIKFGTSSAVGSCSFTVPNDVSSVIIYVAKYKSNTSKFSVNGTAYNLTKNSNDGAYDAITVDTTSNKTVKIATASGGVRAMINTIKYVINVSSGDCQHESMTAVETIQPTCEGKGYTIYECNACGYTENADWKDPAGHKNTSDITVEKTCETNGKEILTCQVCGETEEITLPATGHEYENGKCTVCGEDQPSELTITFNNTAKRTEYSTTKQVWEENGIVVTNNKASSTTDVGNYCNPARFYKSSTVTIAYPGMTKIVIVGADENKYQTPIKDSLATGNIEGATISSQDSEYTIVFDSSIDAYTFTCSAQIRVASITVYFAETKIDSASLTLGDEITLNYYVTMVDDAHREATMHFTLDNKTYDVAGVEKDGRYVYSLEIAPQFMGVSVNAELRLGEETLDILEGYSVKTYAQNKLNAEDSSNELKRLVSDLLHYGAAAQMYTGFKMDELATNGVENLLPASNAVPTETDFDLTNEQAQGASYPVWFAGAGVQFSNVNKIFVKLNLLEGATLENVTLTINGVEVEVTDATVYTDGILPTEFADTYTFVLSYDGVVMQTLTYSVNAYAYAMRKNTSAMGTLALALYNYGVSAAAYNA